MPRSVLLLGLTSAVLDDAKRHVEPQGVELLSGMGIDDVRATLGERHIDHVIMGAGLDLDIRLAIIREVFERSDSTTVHLKDHRGGPGRGWGEPADPVRDPRISHRTDPGQRRARGGDPPPVGGRGARAACARGETGARAEMGTVARLVSRPPPRSSPVRFIDFTIAHPELAAVGR